MARSDSDNGFGGGPDLQFGMDDSQPFPPGDVGQNVDSDEQAMDMDPEDNQLPPPRGAQLMLLLLLPLHHRGPFN